MYMYTMRNMCALQKACNILKYYLLLSWPILLDSTATVSKIKSCNVQTIRCICSLMLHFFSLIVSQENSIFSQGVCTSGQTIHGQELMSRI